MTIAQLFGRVSRKCSTAFDVLFPQIASVRHKDKFSSHLPVLVAVAALTKPEQILELGAGLFSTVAFVDTSLFPTLQSIVSVEDDLKWSSVIRKKVPAADRLTLLNTGSVPRWAETADLGAYPFIFVDDSTQISDRAQTIRAVLSRARADAVIVIHDFEQAAYQAAVPLPWLAFRFAAFTPETAVVFQDPQMRDDLARINQIMLANRDNFRPSSGADWRLAFSAAGIGGDTDPAAKGP